MKVILAATVLLSAVFRPVLAADAEPASEFVVVVFLSAQDAKPGEQVQVTAEIHGRKGVEVLVPDPRAVEMIFEQVSPCGDSVVYGTSFDYQTPTPIRVLKAGEKLTARFVFTVPPVCGVLSVRALGLESVPAAIRVHGDNSVAKPNQNPSLVDVADAISVLHPAFRRVE